MIIFDKETHEFADIFPMMERDELDILKNDIKEQGQLEPIIIYEDKILDGRNRYRAVKELDLTPKVEEYKGDKPLEFVISLNLKRRHLTKDQLVAISLIALPHLKAEARKRQATSTGGNNPQLTPLMVEGGKGEAIQKLAKQFGVGKEYIRIGQRIQETKPELLEKLKSGELKITDYKREERFDKIKKQRAELDSNTENKPSGLFDVIVIDPPWRYDGDIFKENDDLLPAYDPGGYRGSAGYPTMSLQEIKNIKLPTKDDCVLWLWTTNLFMQFSFDILKEWGFEPKSILTWDKKHMTTGRWLRSQTEHCILAIRGKPFYNNTKWTTLISEMHKEHSVKPEIFYRMVEEICAGRKLDYFARKKRENWEAYGDEIK